MRTVFVSEDSTELDAIRTSLEREMAGRRGAMPDAVRRALDSPLEDRVVLGGPDEVAERLISDRERLGIDLLIVRPQLAEIDRQSLVRSLVVLAREVWPAVVAAAG